MGAESIVTGNVKGEAGRMFAVVSSDDRMPVFVKEGYVGFWPCGPDKYYGWALLHSKQGEVVTEAALRGSMVGWGNPAARPAVQWKEPGLERADNTQENHLPQETLLRALSIQQPLSEQILIGKKKHEYRSQRTLIRERVYLYAGKKFKKDVPGFTAEQAALLPRGVILGSVEIVGCHEDEDEDCFVWKLANPIRYPKPLVPQGVPQPGFWRPKF
jgi:hypothetical protein